LKRNHSLQIMLNLCRYKIKWARKQSPKQQQEQERSDQNQNCLTKHLHN